MLTPGASEVAVILGLGRTRLDGEPWVSELELYCRLTGMLERYDSDGGPDAEVGRWMEYGILARLATEKGWTWGVGIQPGPRLDQPPLTHASLPWHARPDALHFRGVEFHCFATIEAKAPRQMWPDEWGDTSDEVPPYYVVQVLAQIAVLHAVSGTELGILAAMARAPGWGAPRTWATYEFRRSARRERAMVAAVERWLDRHVRARVPPSPDGSESAGRTLRRMFAPVDDQVHVATPTDLERYARMLRSRDLSDELAGRMREEQQRLQAEMGEATVLEDGNGQRLATWRPDKNGHRRWRNLDITRREEAA